MGCTKRNSAVVMSTSPRKLMARDLMSRTLSVSRVRDVQSESLGISVIGNMSQRFHQYVGQVLVRWNLRYRNHPLVQFFSYDVICLCDVNIFSAFFLDVVFRESIATRLSHCSSHPWDGMCRSSSVMNICIHMASLTPVRAYSAHMYSASMLEEELCTSALLTSIVSNFSLEWSYQCMSVDRWCRLSNLLWIRIVGVCTRLGTGARRFWFSAQIA